MGIARKCDRCGKFYDYYPKSYDVRYNGVQRIYRDRGESLIHSMAYDLCPECMKAFDEFMAGGKFDEK